MVLSAALGAAVPAAASPVSVPAASPAPTPVVSGNRLLDSRSGADWVAHAVNWPSFEYACQQGWGYSAAGATTSAANAMVSWGITAVRIPVNQDCWLGVDGAPAWGTPTGYRATLASWVDTVNAAGLVAILDLHWSAPSGSVANGQRAMPDAQSVTFWAQAAAAFASSKSVMFETFNEPYSRGSFSVTWSCWRDGGCQVPLSNDQSPLGTASYTAHGQAEIVAAIRAAGATQPILLDGLDYANDLRGWLASRPSDAQLVASWHNYPGQGCQSSGCWDSEILPVAAAVPVIATEFGETDGGSSFLSSFMTWADSHEIGYAPWAWWVTDASDGVAANLYALVSDLSSFTPRSPSGTSYHDHLLSLPSLGTGSVPVFRFWSPKNSTHFYTASLQERDSIMGSYPPSVWTYEGVAYRAFATPRPGTTPLYRFWSPQLGGHFFTASAAEKDQIIAAYPSAVWTFEGVAFSVYPDDSAVAGTSEVFRFWSPRNQHHFYTASSAEKDSVISGYPSAIWTYEGGAFRVPVS